MSIDLLAPRFKKSIRQKLSERVNKELDLRTVFEAIDFHRNRGANRFNDWCVWTARSGSVQLCSWVSMTELVKRQEPLSIVAKNKNDMGPIEIS